MTLTSEEIESLMEAMQDGLLDSSAGGADEASAQSYDLLNPERRLPSALQALDSLHEETADALASILSPRVRKKVTVRCEPSKSLPLRELPPMLVAPTLMARLALSRSSQPGYLLVDQSLARVLMMIAMGADPSSMEDSGADDAKELTKAEMRVISRVLGAFTEAMSKAWRQSLPIRSDIVHIDTASRVAQAIMTDEMIVQTAFDVSDGEDIEGRIQLCLPRGVVEKLAEVTAAQQGKGESADSKRLQNEIGGVQLDLRVELGTARMSFRRLLDLAEGDVIVLQQSESAPLPLLIEGRPKMVGSPQTTGGGVAFVVEGPYVDEAESGFSNLLGERGAKGSAQTGNKRLRN